MSFVTLHRILGGQILDVRVNTDHIVWFQPYNGGTKALEERTTTVLLDSGPELTVQETPSEVMARMRGE
jgi:hypothetical protein